MQCVSVCACFQTSVMVSITKIHSLAGCACWYVTWAQVPQEPEMSDLPRVGVIYGCKPSNVGTRNWTQGLRESGTYSFLQPLKCTLWPNARCKTSMHNLFQVILKEYVTDKKRSEADDGVGLLLLNLLSISSYYFLIVRIIAWFLLFSLCDDVTDFLFWSSLRNQLWEKM